MDQDFFDQGVQQFSGQFGGIFVLFDQIDPLSRILGILVFFFQRYPKLAGLLVNRLLFRLILLRQHLEAVFRDTFIRPIIVQLFKPAIHMGL